MKRAIVVLLPLLFVTSAIGQRNFDDVLGDVYEDLTKKR